MVLVVDVRGQGASVAALAEGFVNHRHDVAVAGVILNRVAERGARTACSAMPSTRDPSRFSVPCRGRTH